MCSSLIPCSPPPPPHQSGISSLIFITRRLAGSHICCFVTIYTYNSARSFRGAVLMSPYRDMERDAHRATNNACCVQCPITPTGKRIPLNASIITQHFGNIFSCWNGSDPPHQFVRTPPPPSVPVVIVVIYFFGNFCFFPLIPFQNDVIIVTLSCRNSNTEARNSLKVLRPRRVNPG